MKIEINKKENQVCCKICNSRWLWGISNKEAKSNFICPNCRHKAQLVLENLKVGKKEKEFLQNYLNKVNQ